MVIRAQGTALLKRKQQTEQKTKSQIFVKSVERSVWVTKISLDAVRFLFNICAKFTCTGTHTIINPFRIYSSFVISAKTLGLLLRLYQPRINKMSIKGIMLLCSQILSIFKTIYGDQSVEFVCGFWGLKG